MREDNTSCSLQCRSVVAADSNLVAVSLVLFLLAIVACFMPQEFTLPLGELGILERPQAITFCGMIAYLPLFLFARRLRCGLCYKGEA